MNFLKKIYHVFFKRDVVMVLFTKSFGKFGKDSVLYNPLCIRGKKDIFIGNNTTILN